MHNANQPWDLDINKRDSQTVRNKNQKTVHIKTHAIYTMQFLRIALQGKKQLIQSLHWHGLLRKISKLLASLLLLPHEARHLRSLSGKSATCRPGRFFYGRSKEKPQVFGCFWKHFSFYIPIFFFWHPFLTHSLITGKLHVEDYATQRGFLWYVLNTRCRTAWSKWCWKVEENFCQTLRLPENIPLQCYGRAW